MDALVERSPLAVAIVVASLSGFAAGFAVERIAVALLHAAYRRRASRLAEATARSLVGVPTILGLLAGTWWAVLGTGLSARTEALVVKGLLVATIAVATIAAGRVAAWAVRLYTEREDTRLPSTSIFVNLARGVVWVLGGLSLLAALGISIAPLLTALGIGGLAVGLALQPTLENVFSGIQVLMSGQIKPGDFIELETGQQGWVEDVTWRNTTVKLLSNDLVIVPNATIGKSLVTNFTGLDEQHIMWIEVGVSYSSDLDLVERVTLQVARGVQAEVEGAVRDHEPLLRYRGFGDSSIGLIVSLRASAYTDRWPLRHEFIKRLHRTYAEAGIEIPFPQRVVHAAAEAE